MFASLHFLVVGPERPVVKPCLAAKHASEDCFGNNACLPQVMQIIQCTQYVLFLLCNVVHLNVLATRTNVTTITIALNNIITSFYFTLYCL